jgi:hypothetical protein
MTISPIPMRHPIAEKDGAFTLCDCTPLHHWKDVRDPHIIARAMGPKPPGPVVPTVRLIEKEGRCPECGSAWIREKYDGTFLGFGYCHAVWRW